MARKGIKRVIDRTKEMSEKGQLAIQPTIRRLELLKETFMTRKTPGGLNVYFSDWECRMINETMGFQGPSGEWKYRLLEEIELLRRSLDESVKKIDVFSDYGFAFTPTTGAILPGLLTDGLKEGDRALVRLNKQPLMPVLIRSMLVKQFGAVTEADLVGTIEHGRANVWQSYGMRLFEAAVRKSLGRPLSDSDPVTIIGWEREKWEWADACKKEQEELDAILNKHKGTKGPVDEQH